MGRKRRRPPADDFLIAGPYRRPRVRLGDVLYCERFGEVVVTGFTERLRWPCTRRFGQATPILTDELLRAIRTESLIALCAWWEVSTTLAWKWRRLLGVGRSNPGTARIHRMQTFTDRERARGRATRRTPASREKSRRVQAAAWEHARQSGQRRAWTAREIAALGTDTDAKIARRLGRTTVAVHDKRCEQAIPAYRSDA